MRYDEALHLAVMARLRRAGLAPAGYSEQPFPPNAPDSCSPAGVYIAVEQFEVVEYVGKACRISGPGLDRRVLEHPTSRTATWTAVWLVPLYDNADILGVEADLIRWLRPRQNTQRPARSGPLHSLLRNHALIGARQ